MTDVRERHRNKQPDGWPEDHCVYCEQTWPCDAIQQADRAESFKLRHSIEKGRADKAEAIARELAEALRDIRDMVPDEVAQPAAHPPCDECAKRQKTGWPPSGLCEDHYRDVSAYLRRVKQSEDAQRHRMRSIAADTIRRYDAEYGSATDKASLLAEPDE